MDMHEFARCLGATEGKDPLFEALDALRHHASAILEQEMTDDPRNPRGWSTWADTDPAHRELASQDR
jgi:hypothetical protein